MKALSLLLIACLLMTGCADLIIRDDDDDPTIAGKTVSRVLLCAVSICASELEISLINQREAQQAAAQQRKDNWDRAIGRLSYDEALRQFGLPSRVLDRSYDFTAVWETPPGPTVLIPGPSLGFGPVWMGAQLPGGGMQLRFDRKSEVLMDWRIW